METHETAQTNRVTEICKLLWPWIGLYPSEFYRPASLLISARSLAIPPSAGFEKAGVWCTKKSHRQSMCVGNSHIAWIFIREL